MCGTEAIVHRAEKLSGFSPVRLPKLDGFYNLVNLRIV
jgi:hypothetical protein